MQDFHLQVILALTVVSISSVPFVFSFGAAPSSNLHPFSSSLKSRLNKSPPGGIFVLVLLVSPNKAFPMPSMYLLKDVTKSFDIAHASTDSSTRPRSLDSECSSS